MPYTKAVQQEQPESGGVRRNGSAGLVLRALLDQGPLARSTIARLTGLSPASVTGHSAELAERGLLCESGIEVTTNGRGRPHVPIDLDTSRHVVCALHIAVEHATIALLDTRGTVLVERRIEHTDLEAATILERSACVVTELLAEYGGGRTVLGLGVATGGWVEHSSGTVVDHPLLGWRDVPVAEVLGRRLGMRVHVDAHSRSLVRAEQLFGHVRSRQSVLMLFVGNVVDAAFASGDQLHYGFRSQAGGIAHLPVPGSREPCSCGRFGCLQATVSERRIVRQAFAEGVIDRPSIWDLIDAAEAGDRRALELFRRRGALVGRAAALLMDVFNPEVVIVVEPGVARFDGCLSELRSEVRAHSESGRDLEETVVATSFPYTTLAVAAGAVLLDALYRDPLTVTGRRLSLVGPGY
jgi:predicted NBD/HSP70 family sugar kinase